MAEKDKNAKQGILFDGKPIFYSIYGETGKDNQYSVTEMYDHQGLSFFSMERPTVGMQDKPDVASQPEVLLPDENRQFIVEMFRTHVDAGARIESDKTGYRRLKRYPADEVHLHYE